MKQEDVGGFSQNEEGFRSMKEWRKLLKLRRRYNRLIAVLVHKVGLTEANAESIAELLTSGEMKKLRVLLEQKVKVSPLYSKESAKVIRKKVRRIWFNNFMRDWVDDSYSSRRG